MNTPNGIKGITTKEGVMIQTKYFDAEANFPGDGEMEIESVYSKGGEDITNVIHALEAWEAVDEIVAAEVERLKRRDAEEHQTGLYEDHKLDQVVGL